MEVLNKNFNFKLTDFCKIKSILLTIYMMIYDNKNLSYHFTTGKVKLQLAKSLWENYVETDSRFAKILSMVFLKTIFAV